ncbi:MAG TPA: glycosyltransferase, partial [Pirellulales bacterium]|nr:glycosyltransferase [Pirellulales bacterium]
AFADSDTRTGRSWLRQLVQHLDEPGVAAATSYRWLVPARPTLANLVLHSLDAGVATVIGPARHHFVWGGSWAIRRETFERYRLATRWRGTLSDDLVAARALEYAGRIRFEPEALAPTMVDYEWADLLPFVRRQFALGRHYAPSFWAVATLASAAHQAVFWTGLLLAPTAAVLGGWTAWALAATAAMYCLQVARAWLRQDAAARLLPDYSQRLARARRFDLWLAPLAGLLGCWGLVSALVSPRIRWRGIHYRVLADGRIVVLDSTITPPAPHTVGNAYAPQPATAAAFSIASGATPQTHDSMAAYSAATEALDSPSAAELASGVLPPATRLGRSSRGGG